MLLAILYRGLNPSKLIHELNMRYVNKQFYWIIPCFLRATEVWLFCSDYWCFIFWSSAEWKWTLRNTVMWSCWSSVRNYVMNFADLSNQFIRLAQTRSHMLVASNWCIILDEDEWMTASSIILNCCLGVLKFQKPSDCCWMNMLQISISSRSAQILTCIL
jgi:hypothetical protein